MREVLEKRGLKFDLTPVESVGYDEDLYQALVAVAGAAKTTKTQTGQVSVDPQELGIQPNSV